MKKLIVGFIVMALCFVTAPLMAAAPKLATNLCLGWQGASVFNSLAIKNGSNLKTSDGNAKQYTVIGNTNWGGVTFPMTGSGYIIPGTTIFHAAFNGAYPGGAFLVSLDLYFDVVGDNGTIFYHLDDGAAVNEGDFSVTSTDCSALPLPL